MPLHSGPCRYKRPVPLNSQAKDAVKAKHVLLKKACKQAENF